MASREATRSDGELLGWADWEDDEWFGDAAHGEPYGDASGGDASGGGVSGGGVPGGDAAGGGVSDGDAAGAGDPNHDDLTSGDLNRGDLTNGDLNRGDLNSGSPGSDDLGGGVPETDDADVVDDNSDADQRRSPAPARNPLGARRVGRHWGRFAELWVPESLREARVDPGRRGALILLLVAALAAVVTAVGVWRDRPEPRAVETSAIAALAAAPDTAPAHDAIGSAGNADPPSSESSTTATVGVGPATAAAAVTEIVVSVTGLVAQPGLVTLPTGARVAEAIAAAGGAIGDAELTGVNLAARLADGDSVVIGSGSAPAGAASGVTGAGGSPDAASDSRADASGLVNLNTADEAALDTLPGVGPVMAQNILAWRETNGKFATVEQLQEISGIGPSRYAQLSPLVTVS